MNMQFFYRSPEGDGGGITPSLNDVGGGTDGFDSGLSAEELADKAAKQDGISGNPKLAELNPDGTPATVADTNGKPGDVGDAAAKLETDEEKTAREAIEAQTLADAEALKEAEKNKENQQDDEDFYQVVDKLRGDEFSKTIVYPDNVEPTSPEGVLIREQAIEQAAVVKFDQVLKEADPRGYAYLLHRQNGGSDKEFFEKPSMVLPTLDELKESVDLQREVYRQGLILNGNTEKQAKALIDIAIKDGELLAESETMHNKIKTSEDAELKRMDEDATNRTALQQKTISEFGNTLTKEIFEGSNLKFIIPEADKPKFLDALKENIHYEDGKFYLIKPLSKDNLSEQLQVELFGYLKGDLGKLVERKAKSVVAQRLTLGKGKEKPDVRGTNSPGSGGMTLGQI